MNVRTGGPRLLRLGERDAAARDTIDALIGRAVRGLPGMRAPESGDRFVFTLRDDPPVAAGTSLRYAAIVALGARFLPADGQREALGGDSVDDLVGALVARLEDTGPSAVTSLGDVALVCWAAAETGHVGLETALARLAAADPAGGGPVFTVDAAWVVSALAAVRDAGGTPEAKEHLERAGRRLLDGLRGRRLYGHAVGGSGLVPRYRAHVGCFADQVYPIQALARLGGDREIAAADTVAAGICAAQGAGGQWWWHYDARTGDVVEGYPVYSVHQHAMAPMALLDLADAGGADHLDAIAKGVRWLAAPPETGDTLLPGTEPGEPIMTWRKVARNDPRKAVRGVRAATTGLRPGWRIGSLDRRYPPVAIDRECRPYELGWLLHTWLVPSSRE
ncbi:hypothetical protein [Actinomadura rubrisoli]|uniref:Uncharacterized protein n=1 Tax=Actinomadura rubrisoli TaxID=2530368 RepID=A0A4V2YVQ6_9ACTN|nr:hypothetical protein [Actinomadura rubrisoli]TDD82367.1 hypothetical protein E1298_22810 [Actinomadura rubrisoli]